MKSKVFYIKATRDDYNDLSEKALLLLKTIIKESKVDLEKEIPIKVHAGEPGNISYIKPQAYEQIINFFISKKIKTYYIETTTVGLPRGFASVHKKVAKEHGFTQIPFEIADGENGTDDVDVKIDNGKFFQTCKIGKKFAKVDQVLVCSHFKGHGLSGFGGSIKMLALGFASRRGKQILHSKKLLRDDQRINWNNIFNLYLGSTFRFRSAEYALAASKAKNHIHLLFAVNIVKDCDCDGREMKPVYSDLGIFASTDPVAIDKACFDMLTKREGKKPFKGDEIFEYAQRIGLGSENYELISI